MDKQDYLRFLFNSKGEISARLETVLNKRHELSLVELCKEIDQIIDRVRQMKICVIFLKNIEKSDK